MNNGKNLLLESGPRFRPYSVVDGNLVTGQNPASSRVTAQNVVKVLSGA